jgi:Phosphatidylserine/phosphatidylglycerophosphate/cardiolipin synthases and related enzymes
MFLKKHPAEDKAFFVVLIVLVTVLAVVFVQNFVASEKRVQRQISHLYSVHDSDFDRSMGIALGPSIVGGNQVVALFNGDEIFPSMLQDIRSAQKSITLETYIYWAGDIGQKFAAALSERARAGVKVNVLVDSVGSGRMDPSYVAMMKQAGVSFRKFRPLRWYNLGRANRRTHRKLLVVDGRIGFTGGAGIADLWTGHAQDPSHWRDSHFRVEGPVVAEMQAAFLDNWIEATGEVLHGNDYFPPLAPAGPIAAQLFYSSPTGGSDSMELMYLLAITAAEQSIYLSSAYFVPDTLTEDALTKALKRGVTVQIITPGKYMDRKIVRGASRSRWGGLLSAGAKMYEYGPTMYHCKVFIVDERLVSVGSTNWDPRSFGLNDEANLNIYDADFARQQVEVFRQDLAKSRQVTLAQWRARPFREKLMERLESLLGGVL